MKRLVLLCVLFLSSIGVTYAGQKAEDHAPGAFFERASQFLSKTLGRDVALAEDAIDFERFRVDIALVKGFKNIDDQILLYSIFNHYYFEFLQKDHPSEALYQLRDEIQQLKVFIEETYIRQQVTLYMKEQRTSTLTKDAEEALAKKFRAAFEHHYSSLLQVSPLDQLVVLEDMESRYLKAATDDEKREEIRLLFDWANSAFRKWLQHQQMKKQKPVWWKNRWVRGAGVVAAVVGTVWLLRNRSALQGEGTEEQMPIETQKKMFDIQEKAHSRLKSLFLFKSALLGKDKEPKASTFDKFSNKKILSKEEIQNLKNPRHPLWYEVAKIIGQAIKEIDVAQGSVEETPGGSSELEGLPKEEGVKMTKEETALARDFLFEGSQYQQWIRDALKDVYGKNAPKYFPRFFTKEEIENAS